MVQNGTIRALPNGLPLVGAIWHRNCCVWPERVRCQWRRVRRWSSVPPGIITPRGRQATACRLFAVRLVAAPIILPGKDSDGVLLICDHASNVLPPGVDLGIDAALLDKHIAVDIGAAPLTRALAAALESAAMFATVSRLVIDLNRQPDHPGLIPVVSDGNAIPGNVGADRRARIAAYHAPFHRQLASQIAAQRPCLLVAVHSFTPQLESGGAAPRPWEVGILYNRDVRAARLAIGLLRAAGIETGDNEPYSGRILYGTLNRHGEATGTPSITLEVRNDLIADPAGVAQWCTVLAPIISEIRNRLARNTPAAT